MKNLKFLPLVLACLAISTSACGPQHENATTGSIVGGAAGAGIGAAVGSTSGDVATGAAVGGALGAASGAVIGDARDKAEINTKEQDQFMGRQREQMKKQEQELQDLRRQKFHDDYFRSQYQK